MRSLWLTRLLSTSATLAFLGGSGRGGSGGRSNVSGGISGIQGGGIQSGVAIRDGGRIRHNNLSS